MLNILWVEDTDTLILEKQQTWFSGRVPDLKTNFIDAMNAIDKNLNQYDLVILDIDLENTPHTEEVSKIANYFGKTETEFLKESGVFLFLQLIEQGFDREQIIFLTGNADENISRVDELREAAEQDDDSLFDEIFAEIQKGLNEDKRKEIASFIEEDNINGLCNSLENYYDGLHKNEEKDTYNRFCDSFKKSLVCPPKGIHKGLNVTKHLNEWLEKHEKNTYLVLRRGIIEGCKYLKKLIKENDDNIQLRSFVKGTKKNNPVIEILTTDIENYLDTVAQFLPVRKPDAINEEYRLFLRTLVHEWEQNIDPQELPREKYGSDIHTFAWLSKQTRNWVSHAKLLEPLNSEIIAFLFLVNMRAIFKLPVEIQSYEQILLKCISKNPANFIDNDELEERINDSKINVDSILESIPLIEKIDKCGKLVNREKTYFEKRYFSEKINDIYLHNTGKTKNHDYQAFLFQLFWANQQNYLADLTANSDDFLPTLARHIYNRKNAEE